MILQFFWVARMRADDKAGCFHPVPQYVTWDWSEATLTQTLLHRSLCCLPLALPARKLRLESRGVSAAVKRARQDDFDINACGPYSHGPDTCKH